MAINVCVCVGGLALRALKAGEVVCRMGPDDVRALFATEVW
jgi:hypothetical protein